MKQGWFTRGDNALLLYNKATLQVEGKIYVCLPLLLLLTPCKRWILS